MWFTFCPAIMLDLSVTGRIHPFHYGLEHLYPVCSWMLLQQDSPFLPAPSIRHPKFVTLHLIFPFGINMYHYLILKKIFLTSLDFIFSPANNLLPPLLHIMAKLCEVVIWIYCQDLFSSHLHSVDAILIKPYRIHSPDLCFWSHSILSLVHSAVIITFSLLFFKHSIFILVWEF